MNQNNPSINIKRVYLSASAEDGFRILVDRLWPRGLSKEKAHVDLWIKEIAPSNDLRKWFNHEPEKWPEFRERYLAEIKSHPEEMDKFLQVLKEQSVVTLLYAAKDEERNNAVVLADFLKER